MQSKKLLPFFYYEYGFHQWKPNYSGLMIDLLGRNCRIKKIIHLTNLLSSPSTQVIYGGH